MATYTSGSSSSSYISYSPLVQTNFSLPASGNKSPNGSYYYLATNTSVRVKQPSGLSATKIFITCGSSAGGTDKLNYDTGQNTTSSYVTHSTTTQYVLVGGTTYYAGPKGSTGSVQSPRKAQTTGYSIWHSGSKYTATTPVSTDQNQTYFAIEYNGVPSKPTSLTAGAATASAVSLTWTKSASNGGSQILGYLIQRSTDGVTFGNTQTINGDVATGSYTGLTANIKYYFRVAAFNNVRAKFSAAYSEWSNVVEATTGTASGAVTGTLSASVTSETQVALTGSITNNKTTSVGITLAGGGTINPSLYTVPAGETATVSSSVTGLTAGTAYTFTAKDGTTTVATANATTSGGDSGDTGGDVSINYQASSTTALQFIAVVKNSGSSAITATVSTNKGNVSPTSYTIGGVPDGSPTGTIVRNTKSIVVTGLTESTTGTSATVTLTVFYASGAVTKTASGTTTSITEEEVISAPRFSTASYLTAGKVDEVYSAQVSATGASGYTIRYDKISGDSWVTVSANGFIGGTPTESGVADVRVRASYSGVTNSPTAERTFYISVDEQSPYWSPENQTINEFAFLNSTYLSSFNAENVPDEDAYDYLGVLPPGITFDTDTGDFSGTPTVAGRYDNIYVSATGKDGSTIRKGPYTIYVLYPGKRRSADGKWVSFANGYRYAPGEDGANFRGWKPIQWIKRYNGTTWENVDPV